MSEQRDRAIGYLVHAIESNHPGFLARQARQAREHPDVADLADVFDDWRERLSPPDGAPLGLIGRDAVLVEVCADLLRQAAVSRYEHTLVRKRHRGCWFELRADDGRVMRVDVTLERVETGG